MSKKLQAQIDTIKKSILNKNVTNTSMATYGKLNEIGQSLYRYDQLSNAGLKDEAKSESTKVNNLINNFNATEEETVLKGGISNTKYVWVAEYGACDDCMALNGTEYEFKDDAPCPLHPNCKCSIEEFADDDDDDEICEGSFEVEQNLANADEASGEIESANEDSDTNADETTSLMDEIQSFSEKVEEAREALVEMIENSDFAEIYFASFAHLLTPVDISMVITLGQNILDIANEVTACYQIFEDYRDQLQALYDAGLCDECTDKFYHASANYDCTKRSEVGEITAEILSISKEIRDLFNKVVLEKHNFTKEWQASMDDLRADWYGIQKAKEQINSEKDLKMSEIKDIFLPKK